MKAVGGIVRIENLALFFDGHDRSRATTGVSLMGMAVLSRRISACSALQP